jgi:hypothetical protein
LGRKRIAVIAEPAHILTGRRHPCFILAFETGPILSAKSTLSAEESCSVRSTNRATKGLNPPGNVSRRMMLPRQLSKRSLGFRIAEVSRTGRHDRSGNIGPSPRRSPAFPRTGMPGLGTVERAPQRRSTGCLARLPIHVRLQASLRPARFPCRCSNCRHWAN